MLDGYVLKFVEFITYNHKTGQEETLKKTKLLMQILSRLFLESIFKAACYRPSNLRFLRVYWGLRYLLSNLCGWGFLFGFYI